MLVPASRTSPVLSRRTLSLLMAAGILACILPTVFFTPAAAQEKKTTETNTQKSIEAKEPEHDQSNAYTGAGPVSVISDLNSIGAKLTQIRDSALAGKTVR